MRYLETENLQITYSAKSNSIGCGEYSKSFIDIEIEEVKVYVPELRKFIKVNNNELNNIAYTLAQENYQNE
jgi:hypothetical protein